MFAAAASGGGSHALEIGATVLSKSNCRFTKATPSLAFGAVDPAGSSPVIASVVASFRCGGSAASAAYVVNSDDGLSATSAGRPRMRHATVGSEFLPYALNLPLTGTAPKNVEQSVTITGTIAAADAASAIAGSFTDTIVVTVQP